MTDVQISNPAGFITSTALAIETATGAARISAERPLPVASYTRAGPVPLSGQSAVSGASALFQPELGRPVWVTLSGNWSGSVTLRRSTDGGMSHVPMTVGGMPLVFGGPLNEQVAEETEHGALWSLAFTLASGTLDYRVSQ